MEVSYGFMRFPNQFPNHGEGMGFTVKGFRICWKVRHRAERAEQEGEAVAGPLDIADVQLTLVPKKVPSF